MLKLGQLVVQILWSIFPNEKLTARLPKCKKRTKEGQQAKIYVT